MRGQADAGELEGELQEGAGGILSPEVILIHDGHILGHGVANICSAAIPLISTYIVRMN